MPKKINVVPLVLGQLQTNCYLLSNASETLIVDPGDDATYISQVMLDKKLTPRGIIATHGHFDHVLAAFELQLMYNIPFFIRSEDQFLLNRLSETAEHFLKRKIVEQPPRQIQFLNEKSKFNLGSVELHILQTPGHTPGSVCLYLPDDKFVLVGDLIFKNGGVGRTDFSYSSATDLKKSIQTIIALPEETEIYSGHGESTTIRGESSYHLN